MDIVHEPERHRFVAKIAGGEALLEYNERPGSVLVYRHTYTPPRLRGRGIAGSVVRFALDHARAHGKTIVPSCSYVARFIDENPQYADLVARDR